MKKNNISKFFIYIIPLALSSFFILFIVKKNNTNYVAVDMDIPIDINRDTNKKNSSSIKKFQLRPFGLNIKEELNSTLSTINKNPFKELGTIESSYNQLPNDLQFTGIMKVGEKEGVFVSSKRGLDIFYTGQEISKGYKIISIDSEKAEIVVTNGLNTKLVKLQQD